MTRDPKTTNGQDNNAPEAEGKAKEVEIIGGGANSYTSKMMRQLAETAPVVSEELNLAELPAVELPNLNEIEVKVPALPAITEQDVMDRFERIYYDSCVERTLRKPGDPIAMGDEVLLDLVGYFNGKILPFSAQENLRIRLEPDSLQPGLGTSLEGTPVGDTKVVGVNVPQDDGDPAKLAFVIDVKNAASLTFPKADDPETLKPLGLGDTLDDVYGSIARMLGEERASATLAQGMAMGLDAIAEQVDVPIEDAHIDAEIRSQWSKTEGRFLMEKGVSRQDMDDALEGWLRDSDTRETARDRLKIATVMMIYTIQDPSELTPEEIEGFFRDYAQRNEIDYDEWRAALADKPADQEALLNEYLYLRTLTHLTSEINLQYEDA